MTDEVIKEEFSKCLNQQETLNSYVLGLEYFSFWNYILQNILSQTGQTVPVRNFLIGLTNQRLLIAEISSYYSFDRLTSIDFSEIEKIDIKNFLTAKIFYIKLKKYSEPHIIKIPKIKIGIFRIMPSNQKENLEKMCQFFSKFI
jgi:hypothetical protein